MTHKHFAIVLSLLLICGISSCSKAGSQPENTIAFTFEGRSYTSTRTTCTKNDVGSDGSVEAVIDNQSIIQLAFSRIGKNDVYRDGYLQYVTQTERFTSVTGTIHIDTWTENVLVGDFDLVVKDQSNAIKPLTGSFIFRSLKK